MIVELFQQLVGVAIVPAFFFALYIAVREAKGLIEDSKK
jgi:hypothetical protein